jgi:outer membrane protein
VVVLTLAGIAGPAHTQVPAAGSSPVTLTLAEAVDLARRNNPGFQQSLVNRRRAAAQVRTAYGALAPNVNTDLGLGFREGRPQNFGGVAFGAANDVLSSSWGLDARAAYSVASVLAPRQQEANADATEADIVSAEQTLRAAVIQQYFTALQAEYQAVLQDSLVRTAEVQLQLARAREQVGSATPLDTKRAEVSLGQQRIAAVQARNDAEVQKLRLLQQVGVDLAGPVRLAPAYEVTEPRFDVQALLDDTRRRNPQLEALRHRERAAGIGVRRAKGAYLPSLSLSAGLGGFTNQFTDADQLVAQGAAQTLSSRASCLSQDSLRRGAGLPSTSARCDALVFTDADAAAIRRDNDAFPFRFERNPYTLNASFSLPVFNGFAREQQVQEAAAAASDARWNARRVALQLTADVTAAWLTLNAAFQSVSLQRQNTEAAREALQLAQERYRVGTISIVDLTTALGDYQRAETDRLAAEFTFHRAFAALEGAVGHPLR